jgi:hypothetical protein
MISSNLLTISHKYGNERNSFPAFGVKLCLHVISNKFLASYSMASQSFILFDILIVFLYLHEYNGFIGLLSYIILSFSKKRVEFYLQMPMKCYQEY